MGARVSSPATTLVEPAPREGGRVSGAVSDMSARQREFARAYVLNGGNATEAAIEAGYGDADPSKAGRRCLVNAKVLHEIKRLMIANVEAHLPIAIRVLVDIASDPECDPRARVQAANSLLDRGGMAAPKGGVQVNLGVVVNGSQAQTLIGEIWEAKSRRLSGIDGGMPDRSQASQPRLARPSSESGEATHGWGGDQLQGPIPGSSSIPPYSHAQQPEHVEPSRFSGEPTWPDEARADSGEDDDDGERGVLAPDEHAGGGAAWPGFTSGSPPRT